MQGVLQWVNVLPLADARLPRYLSRLLGNPPFPPNLAKPHLLPLTLPFSFPSNL